MKVEEMNFQIINIFLRNFKNRDTTYPVTVRTLAELPPVRFRYEIFTKLHMYKGPIIPV